VLELSTHGDERDGAETCPHQTAENTIMHAPIHPQVPCACRFTTGPFAGFPSREVVIIAREVAS